jgi:hypothetical protein
MQNSHLKIQTYWDVMMFHRANRALFSKQLENLNLQGSAVFRLQLSTSVRISNLAVPFQ